VYERTDSIRKKWAAKTDYKLIERDCASFVQEILSTVGLRTPDRNSFTPKVWFPFDYAEAIFNMNNQSQFFDGIWQSTDPQSRWRLEIDRDRCVWIERKGTAVLKRDVPVDSAGDQKRISRSNGRDELVFLGARTQIIDPILARSPQPSYMQLQRQSADTLLAHWNGLVWTLDNKNNLTAIIQPGTTEKGKADFTFIRSDK
jgi:hypothetical protein